MKGKGVTSIHHSAKHDNMFDRVSELIEKKQPVTERAVGNWLFHKGVLIPVSQSQTSSLFRV